jgi:hypothetical protein
LLVAIPNLFLSLGLFYVQSEDEPDPGEERGEWVMLEPRDIMVHPPWDSSEYSTYARPAKPFIQQSTSLPVLTKWLEFRTIRELTQVEIVRRQLWGI